MNSTTRINKLERKISGMSKTDEPIWICICGKSPCTCSEDHKYGRCKKHLSGFCVDCHFSGYWKFMRGNNECLGSPIVDPEELPELLEKVKRGEVPIPIPILGGLSVQ